MEEPLEPTWRKSTRSGGNGGGCVEAGVAERGSVLVRDTRHPNWPDSAPVIAFNADAWESFIDSLR
jgi:hypothetical protein